MANSNYPKDWFWKCFSQGTKSLQVIATEPPSTTPKGSLVPQFSGTQQDCQAAANQNFEESSFQAALSAESDQQEHLIAASDLDHLNWIECVREAKEREQSNNENFQRSIQIEDLSPIMLEASRDSKGEDEIKFLHSSSTMLANGQNFVQQIGHTSQQFQNVQINNLKNSQFSASNHVSHQVLYAQDSAIKFKKLTTERGKLDKAGQPILVTRPYYQDYQKETISSFSGNYDVESYFSSLKKRAIAQPIMLGHDIMDYVQQSSNRLLNNVSNASNSTFLSAVETKESSQIGNNLSSLFKSSLYDQVDQTRFNQSNASFDQQFSPHSISIAKSPLLSDLLQHNQVDPEYPQYYEDELAARQLQLSKTDQNDYSIQENEYDQEIDDKLSERTENAINALLQSPPKSPKRKLVINNHEQSKGIFMSPFTNSLKREKEYNLESNQTAESLFSLDFGTKEQIMAGNEVQKSNLKSHRIYDQFDSFKTALKPSGEADAITAEFESGRRRFYSTNEGETVKEYNMLSTPPQLRLEHNIVHEKEEQLKETYVIDQSKTSNFLQSSQPFYPPQDSSNFCQEKQSPESNVRAQTEIKKISDVSSTANIKLKTNAQPFVPSDKYCANLNSQQNQECDDYTDDQSLYYQTGYSPSEPTKKFQIQHKTEICTKWENGNCKFGSKCAFAHGREELVEKHAIPTNYKTKLCEKFFGPHMSCPYGHRCMFLHVKPQQVEKEQVVKEKVKQPNKKSRSDNLKTIIQHFGDQNSQDQGQQANHQIQDAQKLFKRNNKRLSIFRAMPTDQNLIKLNNQEMTAENQKSATSNGQSKAKAKGY